MYKSIKNAMVELATDRKIEKAIEKGLEPEFDAAQAVELTDKVLKVNS